MKTLISKPRLFKGILFILLFSVLVLPLTYSAEVSFYEGETVVVEQSKFHLTMGKDYNFSISKIIEYEDTLQLGEKNLSVYTKDSDGNYLRTNNTLNEYNRDAPYTAGETVLEIITSASDGQQVFFGFNGFRNLESGNYVLYENGSQIQNLGSNGQFTWNNSEWSARNYTVKCGSQQSCEPTADTTDPNLNVNVSPNSPTDQDQIEITASASDSETGVSQIRIDFDGSQVNSCNSSTCSEILGPFASNSTHTYSVEAEDGSDNAAETSGQIEIGGSNETDQPDDDTGDSPGEDDSNDSPEDEEDENEDSGSGGGEGSVPVTGGNQDSSDAISNLEFGSQKIELRGEVGELVSGSVPVSNQGGSEYTYQIEVENINFFVRQDDTSVELGPGETSQIGISANLSGITSSGYEGSLVMKNGENSKTLPVYVIVQSQGKEFDMDVSLGQDDVQPGSIPEYSVTAYNLGQEELENSTVSVEVRDSSNNVIYRESFPVGGISGAEKINRVIDADLPEGTYDIRATTTVGGESYVASQFFDVKKSDDSSQSFYGIDSGTIIAILLIILLIAIVETVFYFYEWRKFYSKAKEKSETISKIASGSEEEQESVNTSDPVRSRDEPKSHKSGIGEEQTNQSQQESREQIKQKIDRLKKRAQELKEEGERMKKKYQNGSLSRTEYKNYLQNKEQEERELVRKVNKLEDKL